MSPGSVRDASSTKGAPGASSTRPSANLPTRILGPCRSAMMATSCPARCAAARTQAARSIWSCALPWLKFSRTTFTPARIMASSSAGSLDAGPRGATILVARRVDMGRGFRGVGGGGSGGGFFMGGGWRGVWGLVGGGWPGPVGRDHCAAGGGDDGIVFDADAEMVELLGHAGSGPHVDAGLDGQHHAGAQH